MAAQSEGLARRATAPDGRMHLTTSVLSFIDDTKRKSRILVLDDEPTIAFTLDAIFQQAGYEVITFRDGQEAAEKSIQFNPDVALLDVIVPGLDGIAVAIRLIAKFPDCRIILLSGANDASPLLEEAARQGYRFEVLVKPISPDELLAKVKRTLDGNQPEAA